MRLARIRDHRLILDRIETATPRDSLSQFTNAIVTLVERLGVPELPLHIALAGLQDPETGECHAANIPCLDRTDLATLLCGRLGRTVRIANDADCFALAEARTGAAAGHDHVFGIILGTGVGGGLILNGQLARGAQGLAGEWGHGRFLRESDTRFPFLRCGCGSKGCLDTIAGGQGLERLYLWQHGSALSAPEIIGAWRRGEPHAVDTMADHISILSDALALIVNVTGASRLPLGGGLGMAPGLATALDTALRQKILRRSASPIIVKAKLANDAGLIGASYL